MKQVKLKITQVNQKITQVNQKITQVNQKITQVKHKRMLPDEKEHSFLRIKYKFFGNPYK